MAQMKITNTFIHLYDMDQPRRRTQSVPPSHKLAIQPMDMMEKFTAVVVYELDAFEQKFRKMVEQEQEALEQFIDDLFAEDPPADTPQPQAQPHTAHKRPQATQRSRKAVRGPQASQEERREREREEKEERESASGTRPERTRDSG